MDTLPYPLNKLFSPSVIPKSLNTPQMTIGREVDKMIKKTATVLALLAALLCIASLSSVATAQPCDHNMTIDSACCPGVTTEGWFYNVTNTSWDYITRHTPLFHIIDNTIGDDYYGFCINLEVPVTPPQTFNASVYTAEPTCKNNSIAYILNNWTIDCDHCDNVSAGQSAVWYFWYINETFCSIGTPRYNHTATPSDPGWESNWIPDCTAHPLACEFIKESINKSVPYNITISPKTGRYVKGTPVKLEAKVDYCLGGVGEEVTVVFKTDAGYFNESGGSVYKNKTVNGIAKATLVCNEKGANVTVRVKDMNWFEIVDPTGCNGEYQETLRIINITDDASFSFYEITTGELEGYIYEDRSCNCEYNPGYPEPGVAGITVELLNDSTVVNTTETNASGYYKFTNIPPGNYTVRYNASELPAHLSPKCDDDGGSATEGSVIVPEGGKARHNFGVKAVVGISIEKLVNGVNTYTAARNETVTFTLKITNTGDVNLTNITVIDTLPPKKYNKGLTWTGWADPPADAWASSTDPSGWIHFTIHWWNLTQFEPLKPGESFVITFNATVDPEAYGMLRDVANVTANSSWCPGPVSDEDDAFVFVECKKVPVLTPIGIAALIGLLSLLVVLSIKNKKK